MSALDAPVRLAEIFDPASLEELCQAFVDVHEIGLRVFDDASGQIAEIVRDAGLSEQIYADADNRLLFVGFVDDLKGMDLEESATMVRVDPVAGARYLLVPLRYEHDVLGKVIAGPYLHPDDSLAANGPLDRARMYLPRFEDDELQAHVGLFMRSIDLICHAGYRALLTSSLHLESITSAHDDLQRANSGLERANRRLEAQNAHLRDVDELKSNFLATVSHELRTPLTSIIGYSEMLLEQLAGPINDEQQEYLRTIMGRSETLLELIEGLLEFSRADRQTTAQMRPVQAGLLVEEALSSVRPQALQAQVQLDVEVPPDLPTLWADPAAIRQSLINLLGNAVKFTPAGGVVRVSAVGAGRRGVPVLRFAVSDTGVGIPPEAIQKVFEPFFQVDNSSTRQYGGTGLGLSIVRRFVELHGGRVELESAVGVGSTFTFDIPLRPAEEARS